MQSNHPILVVPFSSYLQSFPAAGSFQMSQFFASGGQSIGVSASASVLPMNMQDRFPLGWTGWIFCCPRDFQGASFFCPKDLILGGSKVTADGDCSHDIKRRFLLGSKVMTNQDPILKSTDITLPTKSFLVRTMVFTVVVYRCESWTIKKTEHWRIDAFKLWCWRRLLRVPWTVSISLAL